jgi:AhpD family alkylhydroperoxidase
MASAYGDQTIACHTAAWCSMQATEGIMSDLTFKKIDQSIDDRKKVHLSFLKRVKTYKPLLELEDQAFCDGALDKKIKELMALSISIVTKCEPCMEWHLDQAMQAGATDEEVYETIDVAIEMGGGQAGAYARFVLRAMEYFKEKQP